MQSENFAFGEGPDFNGLFGIILLYIYIYIYINKYIIWDYYDVYI